MEGLKQNLREAIRFPVDPDLVVRAATRNERAADRQSELKPDEFARIREHVGAELVTAMQGSESGRLFVTDPPMVQARKLLTATLAVTESRRWPSVFMLGMTDASEGASMWFTVKQFYGENHPDAVNWFKYNDEEKGKVVQRWYGDLWRHALRAADGEIPIENLSAKWNDRMPPDPRGMIELVFGREMVDRYEQAMKGYSESGYSSKEIAEAAFIMRSVLAHVSTVLL